MARFLKREKGQALVEFALVLPILLLIVFGIIDFGWLFYNKLSVQEACREGARAACVGTETTTEDDINKLVTEKVKENLDDSLEPDLEVKVEYSATKDKVTVTIETKAKVLTPLTGIFVKGQEVDLSDSVTYRVES